MHRAPLATYKTTRNGSLGWDYSTKLSPFLAAGFISPRQIHHAVRVYEGNNKATQDTYWVIFELIWRDYMRFFGLKHGNSIFFEDGPAKKIPTGVTWYPAESEGLKDKLEAWKTGNTGIPWYVTLSLSFLHFQYFSDRLISIFCTSLFAFEPTCINLYTVVGYFCCMNIFCSSVLGLMDTCVNCFTLDSCPTEEDRMLPVS